MITCFVFTRLDNGWGILSDHESMYTTKIDGVVCPPNISETVAGRLMKLAHRPHIDQTHFKTNFTAHFY